MLLEPVFSKRLMNMIILSWEIFNRKVGSGLIAVNKEASMQLKYAYVLQEMIPLTIFDERESIEIELETTCVINGRSREIDILVKGTGTAEQTYSVAIELKCYKSLAASGDPRGATDIFMRDVYYDLYLLEQYKQNNHVDEYIGLVMTNHQSFIYPRHKNGKCWAYDISHSSVVNAKTRFTTPIGGNPQDFTLNKNYKFMWKQFGEYWFTQLQGF